MTLTAPAAGSVVSGSVSVAANAYDERGVTKVVFLVDGALIAEDVLSPWGAVWDSTKVADGGHTLTAKAYDAAGNVGTTSISITVSNAGDVTAPAISNVMASEITETSAKVSWSLDEPATGQVQYGTTTAYGSTTTAETSFNYTTHLQSLTGLAAATTYHYRVVSQDAAGNVAVSDDYTFTTAGTPPDTTAPTITNVAASGITDTSAQVSWSLDEPATGQVEYGTTTAYGSVSVEETTLYSGHVQTLGSLVPGTLYHYRVISKDAAGNVAVSPDFTFTTTGTPPDTTAPTISNVAASEITETSAKVSWSLDEYATGQVEYGATTAYGSTTTAELTFNYSSHAQTLTGLTAGTLYHYRVISKDAAGNVAISPDFTFTTAAPPADITAPTISGVAAGNILENSATISWSLDEPATGQVEYGTTTAYGSTTTKETTLLSSHAQGLTGLSAGTLYHYRVISTDAAGNTATSPDFTFTTAGTPPDTTAPTITNVAAGSITDTGATISWSLDEPATGQVEYGTGSAYGSYTTEETSFNYTAHAQTISGLQAGTTYHYRVISKDAAGNVATSSDRTFTTATAPVAMTGSGSSTYRSNGGCPGSLSDTVGAIKVAGGQSVPAGNVGDVILLERGNTFYFTPQSGRSYGAYTGDNGSSNPRVYSYSTTQALYIDKQANIRFDGLDAYSLSGHPGGEIIFSNGRLGGVPLAVNIVTGGPARLLCNKIGATGLGNTSDSCVMYQPGSSGEVVGNEIGGCGNGADHGKHGVYGKAHGLRVAWNTFGTIYGGSYKNGQSVSIRMQGHVVEHNYMSDPGVPSVGFFNYEPNCQPGNCGPTNIIRYNDVNSRMFVTPQSGGSYPSYANFDYVGNTTRGAGTGHGYSDSFITGGGSGEGTVFRVIGNNASHYSYIFKKIEYCPSTLEVRDNTPNTTSGGCPVSETSTTPPPPPPPAEDTTAPTISNVAVSNITETSAKVSWSLDEPATGQVEYGTTTAYGSFTTEETSFNYTAHGQTISGLQAGTTYHYRVISKDAAGNVAMSADHTFTTVAATTTMTGSGAETYRSNGGCPGSLSGTTNAIKVAGGQAVPAGNVGDVILLERGNTFSFTPQSGRSYGAYTGDNGSANPRVWSYATTQVIYLDGQANVRFDGLDTYQIAGRPGGEIIFSNGRLGGLPLSVNAVSGGPMRILCNNIGTYGLGANSDSCTMWQPGSSGELTGNFIGGCGDGTGPGKHGVYAKADGVRIAWNTFGSIPAGDRNIGQSISIRYQGHVVEHNYTTDSDIPSIGYFSQDETCAPGNCGPVNVIRYNSVNSRMFVTPYGGNWYTYADFDFIGNTSRSHGVGQGYSQSFITGGGSASGTRWRIIGNNASMYTYIYERLEYCPILEVRDNTPNATLGGC